MYRGDWAEKLGGDKPANADDLSKLLVAFTKGDPDGNGRPDTFGLGGQSSELFGFPFFQNMFRVPNGWRKNPDGSLTNAIETEEFRQTLAYMNQLFKAGIYHPDAPTWTYQQMVDGFAANKIGSFRDNITGLGAQTPIVLKITPTAKVQGLVPPGHDGGKGVTYNGLGYLYYTAILREGRARPGARARTAAAARLLVCALR